MDLQGRSILLTGGGSGIGRSLALRLADKEVRLTLMGRRRKPLEEVAAQVRATGSQVHVVDVDLTHPESPGHVVARATEALGSLDVLVNNAGNVRAGRLEQVAEQDILAQVALPSPHPCC